MQKLLLYVANFTTDILVKSWYYNLRVVKTNKRIICVK